MVRNLNLTSFAVPRNALIARVNRKVLSAKTTNINELINNKLRVDVGVITDVLSGIEAKFHKCEMIYLSYLEHADHAVLSGNSATLPIHMECNFMDSTALFQEIFKCDDKNLYRNNIDMNFQTFILMMASIYENLVTLSEIISKKVVVHTKEKPPISTPLGDYLEYLKILIRLGYRDNDDLNRCVAIHTPYFELYLSTINMLRNRYIHGYSRHLNSDGFNYKIITFDNQKFTAASPLLEMNVFADTVLNNTRSFITDLYTSLEKTIRHHTKKVPA